MNVAIYGAGAMGTVLGAYLTKAGYDVDLITRNKAHIDSLKKKGAQITGTTKFTQPVHALLPSEMDTVYDIIFLMTKQRHNKEIVTFLTPYLHQEGVICTMQNGLPEKAISEVIGKDRTIGCTMSWGATFIGRGVVELTSIPTYETLSFSIGKYGNNNQEKFDEIVKMLSSMGKVTIEQNFIGARFAKLLINASFSGLSVITGATFGEISTHKKSRRYALDIIIECIEVANKAGIKIEPLQGKNIVKLMYAKNPLKRQFSLMILPIAMKKHKNIKSSMLRDLSRGYKTEVDAINGVISEYGKKYGVATPLNDSIVNITHKIEDKELISSWNNLKLLP